MVGLLLPPPSSSLLGKCALAGTIDTEVFDSMATQNVTKAQVTCFLACPPLRLATFVACQSETNAAC